MYINIYIHALYAHMYVYIIIYIRSVRLCVHIYTYICTVHLGSYMHQVFMHVHVLYSMYWMQHNMLSKLHSCMLGFAMFASDASHQSKEAPKLLAHATTNTIEPTSCLFFIAAASSSVCLFFLGGRGRRDGLVCRAVWSSGERVVEGP
jgi:hypothetical protein